MDGLAGNKDHNKGEEEVRTGHNIKVRDVSERDKVKVRVSSGSEVKVRITNEVKVTGCGQGQQAGQRQPTMVWRVPSSCGSAGGARRRLFK